jgi:hypothetical protein
VDPGFTAAVSRLREPGVERPHRHLILASGAGELTRYRRRRGLTLGAATARTKPVVAIDQAEAVGTGHRRAWIRDPQRHADPAAVVAVAAAGVTLRTTTGGTVVGRRIHVSKTTSLPG